MQYIIKLDEDIQKYQKTCKKYKNISFNFKSFHFGSILKWSCSQNLHTFSALCLCMQKFHIFDGFFKNQILTLSTWKMTLFEFKTFYSKFQNFLYVNHNRCFLYKIQIFYINSRLARVDSFWLIFIVYWHLIANFFPLKTNGVFFVICRIFAIYNSLNWWIIESNINGSIHLKGLFVHTFLFEINFCSYLFNQLLLNAIKNIAA